MRKVIPEQPFLYETKDTCVETSDKDLALIVLKYAKKKSGQNFDESIFELEEVIELENADLAELEEMLDEMLD